MVVLNSSKSLFFAYTWSSHSCIDSLTGFMLNIKSLTSPDTRRLFFLSWEFSVRCIKVGFKFIFCKNHPRHSNFSPFMNELTAHVIFFLRFHSAQFFFRIQALTQYDLLKDVSLSALGMYSSCVFARAY